MSTEIKSDAWYTKEDEWVIVTGDAATIGVTDFAQDSLSDIVYLELPSEGDAFGMGDAFGVVESVKAAADLMMPIGGQVLAVNEELMDEPENINSEPYESWLIKIKISDPSQIDQLMDAVAYEVYCNERE